MDGDFALLVELVALRRQHGFVLVIDEVLDPFHWWNSYWWCDLVLLMEVECKIWCLFCTQAHGTLVCGENGGGVAEAFGVQHDIDIHVGTLSKAIGCHGGFIASRYSFLDWSVFSAPCQFRWKALPLVCDWKIEIWFGYFTPRESPRVRLLRTEPSKP